MEKMNMTDAELDAVSGGNAVWNWLVGLVNQQPACAADHSCEYLMTGVKG